MFDFANKLVPNKESHQYYLFASGTKMKDGVYSSRLEAEIAMNAYCAKNGIEVECRECDSHERVYTNHQGVRFYINRI